LASILSRNPNQDSLSGFFGALHGVRSPRRGRKPAHWTAVDRDYETIRIGMQTLFRDLALTTEAA